MRDVIWNRSLPARGLFVVMAGLVLAGCALPPSSRMAAPADIAPTADVLDTSGRSRARGSLIDESFDLGSYAVRDVKRSASSGQSYSVGALSSASLRESFRFRFDGRQVWQGRCELRATDRALQVGVVALEDTRAQLECSCGSDREQATLTLEDEGRSLRGEMRVGGAAYAMQQYRFGLGDGGVRSPAVGYRVETPDAGAGVAAVEVLHPGRVWQQRSLPEAQREPMACLLTSLMIYGPQ